MSLGKAAVSPSLVPDNKINIENGVYEEEVDDEPGTLVIDEESYEAHVTPLLKQIRVEVRGKR